MTGWGVDEGQGLSTVRNTLAMGNPWGDFALRRGSQVHTLSSDGTARGPRAMPHKDPQAQFMSLTPGAENFHLKAGADAIGAGMNLALSFTDDLDGDPRAPMGAWDIGADAFTPAPVAQSGPDMHARTGVPTALDGSASYDPQWQLLTFEWLLVEAPAGSTAMLEDPWRPNPSFVPDLPGAVRL